MKTESVIKGEGNRCSELMNVENICVADSPLQCGLTFLFRVFLYH